LKMVKEKRNQVEPNQFVYPQLVAFEKQLFPK